MEKISSCDKIFTDEEKKNYLLNYGVEIEQIGSEIRLYGLNQNIDNVKGKIKREIFFENNKNKVNELKNVKPLLGGIAEKLEEINNWSDENNLINLNRRKSNNNRDYLNKISLTF